MYFASELARSSRILSHFANDRRCHQPGVNVRSTSAQDLIDDSADLPPAEIVTETFCTDYDEDSNPGQVGGIFEQDVRGSELAAEQDCLQSTLPAPSHSTGFEDSNHDALITDMLSQLPSQRQVCPSNEGSQMGIDDHVYVGLNLFSLTDVTSLLDDVHFNLQEMTNESINLEACEIVPSFANSFQTEPTVSVDAVSSSRGLDFDFSAEIDKINPGNPLIQSSDSPFATYFESAYISKAPPGSLPKDSDSRSLKCPPLVGASPMVASITTHSARDQGRSNVGFPIAVEQNTAQLLPNARLTAIRKAGGLMSSKVECKTQETKTDRNQSPRKNLKRLTADDGRSLEREEHVYRERQRRNDMACRVAALEALLPPSSKRDRVAIVNDAVQYVQSLQIQVKTLQERRRCLAESQKAIRNSTDLLKVSSGNTGKLANPFSKPPVSGLGTVNKSTTNQRVNEEYELPTQIVSWKKSVEDHVEQRNVSVEFHLQLVTSHESRSEVVKCRCRPSYLKCTMRILEDLNLEISRCNITKLAGYILCSLIVKTRSNTRNLSTSQVAAQLLSAVQF